MAVDYDLFPMFVKAQILTAAILVAGALFAVEPLVKDSVFTAFDTETTGFSPKNDRLIEIGAVRFRGDGEVLSVTNWLLNPQMPIPFYATEVHGIATEMVTNAPVFSTVWPEFAAFCQDSILLAHNATFDTGFLRAELDRAGIPAPAFPIGNTLPLFRRWFPQAASYSLEPLSLFLGVQGDSYHRAAADAFHIINIFNEGLKSRPGMNLRQLEADAGGFERLDGRKN
jgi:DNA polymerase III epsilon subunit family exonuclease